MTNAPETITYTARAHVLGGREAGRAVTEDGLLDLRLSAPKETGGPGTGTNPEQLFAIGYGACFQSAVAAVAQEAGIDASETAVDAEVAFGPQGPSYAFAVTLTARIPGVDEATAQDLVERAHEICPYSRAVRGNVPVTVRGVVAREADEMP